MIAAPMTSSTRLPECPNGVRGRPRFCRCGGIGRPGGWSASPGSGCGRLESFPPPSASRWRCSEPCDGGRVLGPGAHGSRTSRRGGSCPPGSCQREPGPPGCPEPGSCLLLRLRRGRGSPRRGCCRRDCRQRHRQQPATPAAAGLLSAAPAARRLLSAAPAARVRAASGLCGTRPRLSLGQAPGLGRGLWLSVADRSGLPVTVRPGRVVRCSEV